uniref:FxuD n=1 Tax=Mycolicibacterium smegmatis TaxID=1772 RepID=O87315_MYCSM|nr:FxuD [Mycolicibacterium smegmatis MC2 155]
MRRQHHGDAVAAQRVDQLPHHDPGVRVHPGGRFVEEHEFWTPHHSASEREALLLAAGKAAVGGARRVGEPEGVHEPGRVERVGRIRGDQVEHLACARGRVSAATLQHDADAFAQPGVVGDRVEPEDLRRRCCPGMRRCRTGWGSITATVIHVTRQHRDRPPNRRRHWLRAMAPIFAAAVAIGMVSACGSESEPAAESGATTISHKFGETTVPENPSRVVTVGWTDQDFVLPFGVVPVSAREFSENYHDLPWVQEATGGKGIPTWGSDSIDFEAIAAQKPDLILAIYETIDQQTYDRLSQIAPTVIQSADYADEETPWDVQLLTTGKALGKEAEAKELLDEVQGKIDEARRNNPEFEGKTLVVDFGPADGGHYLLGENDPRRSLFTALGFQTQDVVGDVSEEKLDLLVVTCCSSTAPPRTN